MISRAERRLDVRPVARDEIRAAMDWYEEQSPGLGLEFLRALRAVLAAVRRAPEQYARVHEQTRRVLLRRFPYAVFYRETPEAVIVIAVLHTHRDPEAWHSRREA